MRRAFWAVPILVAVVVSLPWNAAKGQDLGGTGLLKLEPLKRDLGLKTEDFLLLPTLYLSYAYDSNVFYEDANPVQRTGYHVTNEAPNGSGLLRFEPGLRIFNRDSRNIRIAFEGVATVDRYLSDTTSVQEQDNVGGEVGLSTVFLNNAPVSLELHERFRRALERRNIESPENFNRHVNRVGLELGFHPGGRALEITAGYDFVADLFTDTRYDWGDLLYHDIQLTGTWKFFPMTIALLDVEWQIRDYMWEPVDGYGEYGFYGELTNSMPLKIRGGMNGFITKKLSVMGLIGFGESFHDARPRSMKPVDGVETEMNPESNQDFVGVIGEARLSLRWSPNTVTQLGYRRDFDDSLFANYVAYHKVYGNVQQRIADRVDIEASFATMWLKYAQLPYEYLSNPQDKTIEGLWGTDDYVRNDIAVSGELRVTVDITRFIAVEGMYRLEMLNEFQTAGDQGAVFGVDRQLPGGLHETDYMRYTRHYLLGSLILRY